MKISKDGLEIIKHFEGVRLHLYKDSGGLWTIAVGHLCSPSEVEKYKNGITMEEATYLLEHDLKTAEDYIVKSVFVPLTQNQYDALVSFIFNVGTGAFWGSTLRKRLNKKDYKGTSSEFLRWNKVNRKPVAGLTRRRKVESSVFNGESLQSIKAKNWLING